MTERRSATPLLVGCFFGGLLFMSLLIVLLWLTRRHKDLNLIRPTMEKVDTRNTKQNTLTRHDRNIFSDELPSLEPLATFPGREYPRRQFTNFPSYSLSSNRSSSLAYARWDNTARPSSFHQMFDSNRSSIRTNIESLPRPYSYQSLQHQSTFIPEIHKHLSLPPNALHDSSAYAYLNNFEEGIKREDLSVPLPSSQMAETSSATINTSPNEELRPIEFLGPLIGRIPRIVKKFSPNGVTSETINQPEFISENNLRYEGDSLISLINGENDRNFKKPRPVSCGPYFANSNLIPSSGSFISRKNTSLGHGGQFLEYQDETEELRTQSSKGSLLWKTELGLNVKQTNAKVRVRSLSLKKIRRTTFKSMEGIEVIPKLIRDRSTGSDSNSNSSHKRSTKFSDPFQIQQPTISQFQSVSHSSTFRSTIANNEGFNDHALFNQEQQQEIDSNHLMVRSFSQPTSSTPITIEKLRRSSNLTINSLTGEVRSPLRTRVSPGVTTDSTLSTPTEIQKEIRSFDSNNKVIGHEL